MTESVVENPDNLNQWRNYLLLGQWGDGDWNIVATSDNFDDLVEWGENNPAKAGIICCIVQVLSPYYEENKEKG